DETGAVRDIPYARIVPPQAARPCVPAWHIEEKNRLLWAWYHPQGAAPLWPVEAVADPSEPDWTAFGRKDCFGRTHLKEMAENGADSAHFRYVHGPATFPEMETKFDGHRREGIVRARMDTPRGPVDGQIAFVAVGPGQSWNRFSGICET